MKRYSEVKRKTAETSISLSLNIDGSGDFTGSSCIPFFDHMLNLWSHHGKVSLGLSCEGDLEVDGHHTIEDIGICLGQCIQEALGEKRGINRYGWAVVPMDEALAMVALDISGRPFLEYDVHFTSQRTGSFDAELVEEFFRALCIRAGITMHIRLISGRNTHHIIEAVFKAFARAFKEAVQISGDSVPSTKGMI